MSELPVRRVALLRGVNVGGINIRMADLARVFRELGFAEVRTVLASGNVLFSSPAPNDDTLKRRIEQALAAAFGYEAWVIVVDLADLAGIVDRYPFAEDDATKQPYVMFLTDTAVLDDLLDVREAIDPALERLQPDGRVLYWELERGHSTDTVFAKHSAKPRFKAVTTTRNMRTLRKLLA